MKTHTSAEPTHTTAPPSAATSRSVSSSTSTSASVSAGAVIPCIHSAPAPPPTASHSTRSAATQAAGWMPRWPGRRTRQTASARAQIAATKVCCFAAPGNAVSA